MTIEELDDKLNSPGFQDAENGDLFYNFFIYQYPAEQEYDIRRLQYLHIPAEYDLDMSQSTNSSSSSFRSETSNVHTNTPWTFFFRRITAPSWSVIVKSSLSGNLDL